MKISRRVMVMGAAAVFGITAGCGVHFYIADKVAAIEARAAHPDLVKQIVANDDMPRGSKLNTATVSVRAVPREWAYADALLPDQLDRFENAALETPARRGQPILWAQVMPRHSLALSERIEPGRRAVTVPVDDISSVSGMVTPGDRIDLLVSIKRNAQTLLLPVLQRTLVLATGVRTDARAPQDANPDTHGYTNITLDVSPEDAKRIFAARETGQLTAVLRAPADETDIPMQKAEALTILGINAPVQALHVIPVIYADQLGRNSFATRAAGFAP